jgi:hypothetical protein
MSGNSSIIGNLTQIPNGPQFNTNYAMHLKGTDENGTRISIFAFMPEQFGLHIQADWHSLLNQASIGGNVSGASPGFGGIISSIAGIAKGSIGQTDIIPALTHQVWTSTSPLQFSIPFQFNAIANSRNDVMDNLETLFSLVSPSLNSLGTLKIPGPTIVKSKSKYASKYKMNFFVGTTYVFQDIIVTGVNEVIDVMFDKKGGILSAQVDVSISTSRILTKKDIKSIFGNTTAKSTSITNNTNSNSSTSSYGGIIA